VPSFASAIPPLADPVHELNNEVVAVEYQHRSDPCRTCGQAVVLTRPVVRQARRLRRGPELSPSQWSSAHAARQDPGIGVDDDCPFGAEIAQPQVG
jgi:hypothetical protein